MPPFSKIKNLFFRVLVDTKCARPWTTTTMIPASCDCKQRVATRGANKSFGGRP